MGDLLLAKYAEDPRQNGVQKLGRLYPQGSTFDEMLDRLREVFLELRVHR
jgi:hypothetical protein